jgi:hypothetical protein
MMKGEEERRGAYAPGLIGTPHARKDTSRIP